MKTNLILIPVKSDNKWGYVDNEGREYIYPKYDKAYSFTGKYAYVVICKYRGIWGIIDKYGTVKFIGNLN